jgi:hypothetical protein
MRLCRQDDPVMNSPVGSLAEQPPYVFGPLTDGRASHLGARPIMDGSNDQ